MLVLARHPGEAIRIGSEIRIVITNQRGSRILVGIEAPRNIIIDREEIYLRKREGLPFDAFGEDGSAIHPASSEASPLAFLAFRFRERADANMKQSREARAEHDVIRLTAIASTLDWAATELEFVTRNVSAPISSK